MPLSPTVLNEKEEFEALADPPVCFSPSALKAIVVASIFSPPPETANSRHAIACDHRVDDVSGSAANDRDARGAVEDSHIAEHRLDQAAACDADRRHISDGCVHDRQRTIGALDLGRRASEIAIDEALLDKGEAFRSVSRNADADIVR